VTHSRQTDRVSNATPPPVRLRSPLARAVVPVVAGIAFFVVLGLATWGIAAYISRDGTETSERLMPTTLPIGSAQSTADLVREDGPILLPGLATTTGERTLVLDHEGDDPTRGWRVYYAFPADGDASCAVEQVIGTREFVDCNGRTIVVNDLAPPDAGINPVVEDQRFLVIDLNGLALD
jgi:hypothetical protein